MFSLSCDDLLSVGCDLGSLSLSPCLFPSLPALCLASHSAPDRLCWTLFHQGQNCWKGFKKRLPCLLLWPFLLGWSLFAPCWQPQLPVPWLGRLGSHATDIMVPAHPPFQAVPLRSWCILMAVSGSQDQGGI